jgi:hypothetical protein
VQVDARVSLLVAALNELPAIETFSSCGGHDDPDDSAAQVPADEFYVSFNATPSEQGWQSLALVVWAADTSAIASPGTEASVGAWYNNMEPKYEGPERLSFTLSGRGIEPDVIARNIQLAFVSP